MVFLMVVGGGLSLILFSEGAKAMVVLLMVWFMMSELAKLGGGPSLQDDYWLETSDESGILVLLSIILIIILMMNTMSKSFMLMSLYSTMGIILVLVFKIVEGIFFFFFFESSLIPIFILILGWGYQPERLQASFFMLLYTLTGSLPLLLVLFYLDYVGGGTAFGKYMGDYSWLSFVLLFGSLIGFLIKFPVYGVHLWLPKAHVEAPVEGSMILAGVLLKLGGIGVYRVMVFLQYIGNKLNVFFLSMFLWGGLLLSIMCFIQIDIKILIAYSSVVHMSVVVGGMLGSSAMGVKSGFLIMVSHGFISSGLFFMGFLMYKLLGSRSMFSMRGIFSKMGTLSYYWFIMVVWNMGCPPSLNVVGEIVGYLSVLWYSWTLGLVIWGTALGVSFYSIYLYGVLHGEVGVWEMSGGSLLSCDMIILKLHIMYVFIGMFMVSVIYFLSSLKSTWSCGLQSYYQKIYLYWGISMLLVSLMGLFLGVMVEDNIYYLEWVLLEWGAISWNISFLIDWVGLLFLGFVSFISSMVIFYSKVYMEEDYFKNRFLALVLLFVFSMMLLIFIPNLISMLIGWDGLGLSSYLLVIYYSNKRSLNNGALTILANRVGDLNLLIMIGVLVDSLSWDLYLLEISSSYVGFVLFIVAMITKSAQVPFSAWLPAAMAAPTPVSSLVHSSTLVTAGLYMLIRYFHLFNYEYWCFGLGTVTLLMAGFCGVFEMDIKKIIALSTLSQLGVMMCSLGLGAWELAYFHLLMHSMFKALLFLNAGSFMHSKNSWQDFRVYGGLVSNSFFHSLMFMGSSLALMGFPFMAGFYSKDLIYEVLMLGDLGGVVGLGFLLGIMFTSVYSVRLMLFGVGGFQKGVIFGFIKDDLTMSWSMISLFIGACINGGMFFWVFSVKMGVIYLPFSLKIMSMIFMIIGAMLGVKLYEERAISWLGGTMWGLVRGSTKFFGGLSVHSSKSLMLGTDAGWFLGGYKISESMVTGVLSYKIIRGAMIYILIGLVSGIFILLM